MMMNNDDDVVVVDDDDLVLVSCVGSPRIERAKDEAIDAQLMEEIHSVVSKHELVSRITAYEWSIVALRARIKALENELQHLKDQTLKQI